jgi:hypothetical protein
MIASGNGGSVARFLDFIGMSSAKEVYSFPLDRFAVL